MRILVTGALGHIGSRLIRDLPLFFPSAEVVMVDSMMTQRYCSLFHLPMEGNYKFIEADITQVDLLALLKNIDVVVHLAAITDATGSYGHAEQLELNNFNATKKIAEACLICGVYLIAISSTSIYGTEANVVDEDCSEDELRPQSPYAVTKLKEENLIKRLVAEKGLKAVILRFGTIFGVSPGMRFHTAVNKFVWQAVMGQSITVWSTAYDQKRPYLYLGDAVRAIIFVIKERLFTGLIYNVVTVNVTVRQVVEMIRIHVPALELKFIDSPIMNKFSYDVLNARFKKAGFDINGNLESGIKETINLLRVTNNE